MAPVLAAALLLLAAGANACLLPPKGCFKQVCNRYANMIIPGSLDFGTNNKFWTGEFDKLAFIRSAFNKNLGTTGPSSLDNAEGPNRWLNYLTTFPKYGFGKLPSVNYEFYEVAGKTVKTLAKPIPDAVPDPTASLAACCHACRLTTGCPMYMYLPSNYTANAKVTGGTCYFVSTGGTKRDGPFEWVDATNRTSARTKNIGAPVALSKAEGNARYSKSQEGLSPKYPNSTFALVFLGGYCNPNTHPNGSITDDPHFTGAHGTRFDFNGELDKAFCLVTDKYLHINAVLKGYESDNTFGATVGSDGKGLRSWIRELGLIWNDGRGMRHTLRLVARTGKEAARGSGFLASAAYDGQEIAVPGEAGSSFKSDDLTLMFLGTAKKGWYDLDRFNLAIGKQLDLSFNMRVAHPKLQAPDDAEVHFNLLFNDVKVTSAVHGVLGQTYRDTPSQIMKAVKYSELNRLMGEPVRADGASGAGFLEGAVQDYESTGVLSTDCKVSAFQ